MEVWANLKTKLTQRQMVVYQPWTGPQSRHTSHEKDYFEQRKSMVKFLQEYNLGKLSKTDEQTLHYLTNILLSSLKIMN